ncbi:MAG: IMP dehydrogenase [Candidatus Gracilibacteria bacterium]|nr:IMP dehydrogenase [Candidatus Gracilibacteria bacterium]MDQ7022040.1 IMP dehydrogenase [Candidatus Gracilibacteria bacterium]
MKIRTKALTFNDVLLVPHYSEVLPKTVSLKTKLTKKIEINIPFISAAMDTVTESRMAISLANLGGVGVIHKNMDEASQIEEIKKVKNAEVTGENAVTDDDGRLLVAGAIGVGMVERAKNMQEAGCDIIVLDSAHGHSKGIIDTVKAIKKICDVQIIAGNVATREAVKDLAEAGADAVKVGIGPGSICTTRIVAGVGFPQLSAIADCVEEAHSLKIPLIADGGIKYSGDVAKALAVGASTCMMGSVLAKSFESPGEVFEKDGKKFKAYRGMGSIGAMTKGSSDRYFQTGTAADKLVPEGVEAMVELQGSVESIIFQFVGGLRSSMGYLGAKDIETFWKHAEFVEITSSGLAESHVHDVTIIKESPNYK